jgi:hypothetical protein
VRSAGEDLAVFIDPHFDSVERTPHRARAFGADGVERDDGRGFRETVALDQVEPNGAEKFFNGRVQPRASANEETKSAELAPNLREN